MNRNELIRYLLERLAAHQASASEIDYGRIEELCHLLCAAMRDFKSLDGVERAKLVLLRSVEAHDEE